jgi:lipopolysaccharide export system protein LptA
MSRRWCAGTAALMMLAIAGMLTAQGQTSKVIVLQHADSLVGGVVNGEDVRELIGNVQISQESVRIRCDHALQYIGRGMIELTGNVVVEDDSLIITAPRGFYYRDPRRAEAFGRVTLDDGVSRLEADYGEYLVDSRTAFFHTRVVASDSGSILNADSVRYDRIRRFMDARGRVVLYSTEDQVTISGGHFQHDATRAYSRMTVEPVLLQKDSTAEGVDTLIVRSQVMESFRDSTQRLVASDSVKIVRSDLAGTAGSVVFFTAADSLLLRTAPVLWYAETQVTGDSINLYLRKRVLERITVMGNAFAVSRSDSQFAGRYDQLTGEWLSMTFAEKKLERIDVDIRATSIYFLYEDSAANGVNKTSGDRIVMRFAGGQAKAIHVYGGVEGQYIPEVMVGRREDEYRLPGFLWREDRPRISPADVAPYRQLRQLPH